MVIKGVNESSFKGQLNINFAKNERAQMLMLK